MIKLEDLISEDEKIAEYGTTDKPFCLFHCIIRDGSTDISGALEDTLHRILDAGGTEDDIGTLMGLVVPDQEMLDEYEKEPQEIQDEMWTYIDLDYVLPGLMATFKTE